MGFSLRLRKKKTKAPKPQQQEQQQQQQQQKQKSKKTKSTTAAPKKPSRNAKPNKSNSSSNSGRGSFASPLITIDEAEDDEHQRTNETLKSTPGIPNVNVVDVDGETEIVYGSLPRQLFTPDGEHGEIADLNGEYDEEFEELYKSSQPLYEIGEVSDDEEYDADDDADLELSGINNISLPMEEYDDDEEEEVLKAVVHHQASIHRRVEEKKDDPPAEPPAELPFDEPFDEVYMKKEDPYIMEIMRTESMDENERLKEREREARHKASIDRELGINEFKPIEVEDDDEGKPVLKLARTLASAFHCNGDTTTAFYDTVCSPELCSTDVNTKKRKRPYFSELFAMNFILEAMEQGVPMMWHRPPSNPVDNDWTGQSMTMYIVPGVGVDGDIEHPKFVWMRDRDSDADEIQIAVDMMDIHTIMDKLEDEEDVNDGEEEDMFFFSITCKDGSVFLFECHTERERDRTVAGIKNILARLSYGLIVGDDVVTKELYGGMESEGDLPSLKTPTQELMSISHAFLDSVATQ